jgi:hypothetical protein
MGGNYNELGANSSNSLVGAGTGNTISLNSPASVIVGGCNNQVHSSCNVIVGGQANQSCDSYTFVGGGRQNVSNNTFAVVVGGCLNVALAACSFVGGGCGNHASGSISVIGGGRGNTASGTYSTVSGGYANEATNTTATVSGGYNNCARGIESAIGGGRQNQAPSSSATVSGGYQNYAQGNCSTIGGGTTNVASECSSTIAGGKSNTASNCYAAIGGGCGNAASGKCNFIGGGKGNCTIGAISSAIVGGGINRICTTSAYGSIIGGYNNEIVSGSCNTIGGGKQNKIGSEVNSGMNVAYIVASTIAGGQDNCINGCSISSFIGGGQLNCIFAKHATIAGGCGNLISGSTGQAINHGRCSFIGGGQNNTINIGAASTLSGGYNNCITGNCSFIGGGKSNSNSGTYASVVGGINNVAAESCGAILGGKENCLAHANSFIIGSNLTSSAACTTFMNCIINESTVAGTKLTGSFSGSFVGNGTNLNLASNTTIPTQNPFPLTASSAAIISRSIASGDTDSTALRLLGSGSVSESGIFEVEGSAGPLFSVADGLDGILMEVNNISGLPLFQVSSSNEVFINRGNLTSGVTTATASFAMFSGSFQGNASQLTNISAGNISGNVGSADTASFALTASSFVAVGTTSGLVPFTSTNGELTAESGFEYNTTTNQLTVESLNVTHFTSSFITSSRILTSGSNIFGDDVSDTQTLVGTTQMTGSAQITGSLIVSKTISSSGAISAGSLTIDSKPTIDTFTSTIEELTLNPNGDWAAIRLNRDSYPKPIIVEGSITSSYNVSGSATSTASFGHYLGDGSQLTNLPPAFPFTGNAGITGSLSITGSGGLSVESSGSTVFEVIGSEGTLFTVDDDLDGVIFTANDRTGNPVLQASASGKVYIGKAPQSLYTTAVISSTTAATTQSIFGLSTSSYGGAFFDYTVQSGSDARAGSIMSVWNGSNISFTETTTTDIGDTTDFNVIVHISQSQAQIASHASRAGYNIKTIIRSI